ncbi:MAG: VOC family protein [Gammaproteobacteria bacterium]|nr:VOC family protein [Gammaproteobacteria bacterium]
MLKQLATAVYYVENLTKAKQWIKQIFLIDPYFDEAFYVGYNIGGFELGLLPGTRPPNNNVVAYWRVDNIGDSIVQFIERGAEAAEPIEEVGEGIKVATIIDPFGNHFGIIENPHFKVPWLSNETKQS